MLDDSSCFGEHPCITELFHIPIAFFKQGFVIERINLTRPPLHKQEDNTLCLRGMMRLLGS